MRFVDAASAALWRATRASVDLGLTAIVVFGVAPLWFLPRRPAVALGRTLGYCGFFVWPLARRAGMINLRRAYGPSMSRARARRWTWTVFGNLGASIAEGLQFARRYGRRGVEPTAVASGPVGGPWEEAYECRDPALERRMLEDPRPKVFVTGHLGSWEVMALLVGLRFGERGAAIVRRIDNPFLNALVRRVRTVHASQWIEKRGGAMEAIKRLRAGQSVAVLLDENGGRRGPFVDFFGRPASTRKTAALLAVMTGAPIVIGAAVRQRSSSKYLLDLVVIEPTADQIGRPEAAPDLTRAIVRVYERWIRERPLDWRWIHWRWRTRPDGSEETYTRRDLRDAFAEPASDAAMLSPVPLSPCSPVPLSPCPPVPVGKSHDRG